MSRRLLFALEDLVALAVLDLEYQWGAADRLEIEGAERQGADMDDLAGLVERLVGDEQDLVLVLDLDLTLELLLAEAGARGNLQLVRPGGQGRDRERDGDDTIRADLAGEELV